jgi:hypothetical protein
LNTEPRPLLALPGYATALDAELKAEARQLGIEDRVKLLGWLSDPDLEGLYEAASCFVFPSLAEGRKDSDCPFWKRWSAGSRLPRREPLQSPK